MAKVPSEVDGHAEASVTALVNEGPDKGPGNAPLLYFAKQSAFITVGISGIDDEKSATEKAKTLARKILGKL